MVVTVPKRFGGETGVEGGGCTDRRPDKVRKILNGRVSDYREERSVS